MSNLKPFPVKSSPVRVAIVGSGISGLAAAHALKDYARITLFEAGGWFGGHTHTVDVTLPTSRGEATCGVDTGFLVFNDRTYPNLIKLFDELGVATTESEMSFSVQVPACAGGRRIEWSGKSLNTVFAQRRNLLDAKFLGMLADLLRFNALCTRIASAGAEDEFMQPLGDFLHEHRLGSAFREWYLLPMLGSIWSCPTDQMLKFPVATMVRFCYNHGLLKIAQRPQWRAVSGGARNYVDRILAGVARKHLNTPVRHILRDVDSVSVVTDCGVEHFDELVLATHSDQALALLNDPTALEREVLGAIRFQPNHAVLHTDASVLPQRRSAWAAWNYENAADGQQETARVCLHYLLNKLQPLPFEQPVMVSLNPARDIDPRHVIGAYDYDHPVLDLAAIRAQRRVPELQGYKRTWFCGAWTGYGFHEDGLKSGLEVAHGLRASQEVRAPWKQAA